MSCISVTIHGGAAAGPSTACQNPGTDITDSQFLRFWILNKAFQNEPILLKNWSKLAIESKFVHLEANLSQHNGPLRPALANLGGMKWDTFESVQYLSSFTVSWVHLECICTVSNIFSPLVVHLCGMHVIGKIRDSIQCRIAHESHYHDTMFRILALNACNRGNTGQLPAP